MELFSLFVGLQIIQMRNSPVVAPVSGMVPCRPLFNIAPVIIFVAFKRGHAFTCLVFIT